MEEVDIQNRVHNNCIVDDAGKTELDLSCNLPWKDNDNYTRVSEHSTAAKDATT